MKKQIINQKKGRGKLWSYLLAGSLLTGLATTTTAQTGYATVVHQPCNGDGELAVTVTSGLTPPLDYYYYHGGSPIIHYNVNSLTDVVSGLTSAISEVQVRQVAGTGPVLWITTTGMVPPFTLDPVVTTNAICPALTGTAQVTINGGTMPASVQWYDYTGTSTYVGTGNPISLAAGYYAMVVTDAGGCVVSSLADSSVGAYIQNISGINFSVNTTTANCTNGTASISGLSGGMAPYSYSWSNGASTSSINSLSVGVYAATVTDAQGCHEDVDGYVPQAINIRANPVVTGATCLQNDGEIMSFGSGGTPPYTYSYSNGMTGQTITGLAGESNIVVYAMDANGCSGYDYTYVNTTSPVSVTYTATSSLCTAPTGSATLTIGGGTAPYTVSWGTSPAASGTTLSGKTAGFYSFTVTDAVGCVRTGTAVIPPQSVMTATIGTSNPVCPATTGNVNVLASSTNPPLSYAWSNGATSPTITGVPVSGYSCVITDAVGCALTKYASLSASSPISIGLNTTVSSCIYSPDGSITATPTGGTAPYVYNWSDGQTTAMATGLMSNGYSVNVTDANGCSSQMFAYVPYNILSNSCYCTITGKVFNDVNGNCIMDSGENGIAHIMMHCDNFGYAFTDGNGDYTFLVPSGSYIVSEVVQASYPLAACQSNAIPVTVTAASGCVNTINFANNPIPLHDVHLLRTSIIPAVPGNACMQGLIVQNDGTLNESNIQLGYSNDGQLVTGAISPLVYTQPDPSGQPNWYTVNSGFPAVAPGASTMVYFNYMVPSGIPLATLLNFNDTAATSAPLTGWIGDYTPWNNVQNFQAITIGSYDPNFKEVSPKGFGPEGNIQPKDSVLDYVVHFQNTGTYYANKVVVKDALDSDLDWSSLRLGYSDHNYTATMDESGVLTFTFENIHLDWQANSELGSRGLVSYSIKQKTGLTPGTEIKNTAAIYFDYNAPVMTNQTLNTIQLAAGIAESNVANNISIYPNPATDELNISMEHLENLNRISIYDLQGRLVQSEKIAKNSTLQKVAIGTLMNGIYFIVLEKNDGQKTTARFIKN